MYVLFNTPSKGLEPLKVYRPLESKKLHNHDYLPVTYKIFSHFVLLLHMAILLVVILDKF